MAGIRAVIFDMDGVLIDSEIVYLKHQHEALHRKYPWVTMESLFPLVGMSAGEDRKFLAGLLKRDETDPDFQQEIRDLYSACTVYYPDIVRPQAKAVLKELKALGFQLALASSSSTENIRTVLSQCKLTEFFDQIISGDQFRRSKPDPEIYQHTMKLLGRKPKECLVVEDSTYGIQAAAAAGAVVAALKDERFGFDQHLASLQIDSLSEVPAVAMCGGLKIKAAFFDIDGTLAEEKTHYIPESTRRSLKLLKEKGIYSFLSTGRHAMEIIQENLIQNLCFDGGIYINGQLCEVLGEQVCKVTIPRDNLLNLKAFLNAQGRSCIFMEADRMYTNLVDNRIETEQARIGTAVPPVIDIDDLETREVLQVIPFISREEEPLLMAAMPDCVIFRWGENVVDVNCGECGKDAGLRVICKSLGIQPEETIAFGDAQNDLGILRSAGIGVAMGGAKEEIKAAADYVTDTVRGDGIYKALKHFCLV